MKKGLFKYIFLFVLIVSLNNCSKVRKGYKVEKTTIQEMQEMVNSKVGIEEFLSKFGSPSFTKNSTGFLIAFNR